MLMGDWELPFAAGAVSPQVSGPAGEMKSEVCIYAAQCIFQEKFITQALNWKFCSTYVLLDDKYSLQETPSILLMRFFNLVHKYYKVLWHETLFVSAWSLAGFRFLFKFMQFISKSLCWLPKKYTFVRHYSFTTWMSHFFGSAVHVDLFFKHLLSVDYLPKLRVLHSHTDIKSQNALQSSIMSTYV